MEKSSFARAVERSKDLPSIQTQATAIYEGIAPNQKAMGLAEETEESQATAIDAPTGTETSTASETKDEQKPRTKLQMGTGIALIIIGSMGMIEAAVPKKKSGGTKRVKIAKKTIKFGLSTWAFIAGIMLVADKTPSSSTIKAAQGYLGAQSVMLGIAALGLGVNGIRTLTKKITPNADGTRIQKGVGSLIASVFAAGLSAGFAVWSSKLDNSMKLAETMNAKDKLASKISRAFFAFKILEERCFNQGALITNPPKGCPL